MPMNSAKKAIRVCSALGLIACIAFSVYAFHLHLFTSREALQSYVSGFGPMSALVFIVFQAVQVVVPIIPGGIGCLGGVLLFGPRAGFLYNYIGICIGSFAAFAIARAFGKPVLHTVFKDKTIAKYEAWTGNESKFVNWFALAIFFPVAPDDFLCYLAGTTPMGWWKFITIILLGKPAAIALYSMGLNLMLQQAISLTN